MRVRLNLFHRDFKALHVRSGTIPPPPPDHHHQAKVGPGRMDGQTDREICLKMLVDGLMDLQIVLKSCTICPLFVSDIHTSPPPFLIIPRRVWAHRHRPHHCRALLRGRHCHQYLRRRGRRGGPNPAAGSLEERWCRSRRCPEWRWES